MHKKNKKFLAIFSICSLLLVQTLISFKTSDLVQENKSGFVKIFDGKTLKGWEGDPDYWRVENGNLVGEITPATL